MWSNNTPYEMYLLKSGYIGYIILFIKMQLLILRHFMSATRCSQYKGSCGYYVLQMATYINFKEDDYHEKEQENIRAVQGYGR